MISRRLLITGFAAAAASTIAPAVPRPAAAGPAADAAVPAADDDFARRFSGRTG